MPNKFFFINKAGPIHASTYLSSDQVLLASGAGPSKTGQKNRIAAYSISQSLATSDNPLERSGVSTGETLLGDDEDAPSSFALHEDLLIAGVNESAASRKESGDNHHLRTFRMSKQSDEKGERVVIKKTLEHQIYQDLSIERDDYQKITKVSRDGLYAGLISDEGIAAIVDMSNMTKLSLDILDHPEEEADMEKAGTENSRQKRNRKVVDLEFAKDVLWIATPDSILTIPLPSGENATVFFSLADSGIPKSHKLTHLRMTGPDSLLLGLNHQSQNSSFIADYKIFNGTLLQRKVTYLSSKLRGLYINTKKPVSTPSTKSAQIPLLIMATTADGNLTLYSPGLEPIKVWKGLHRFPISTICFRDDAKQAITCSIDEKVNVLDLEDLGSPISILNQLFILFIFMMAYIIYMFFFQKIGSRRV